MSRNLALLSAIVLWGGSVFCAPQAAHAETPLRRAVVQSLRNAVQLLLQNQSPRPAKVRDALIPGDALSTARSSLAELRFNDGSLARVGEQALFRFAPRTRTFQLSNGTLLLLIPPGQGQTRVRTPNAVAGIRGSALFVRYIPETDITVVGALTNSGIQVSNRDNSQNQVLQAGQLVVLVKDRVERIYNFDLKTFYETSDLVQDLDLQKKSEVANPDAAIAAVQAETSEAANNQVISSQTALAGEIRNPNFLRRPGAENPLDSLNSGASNLTPSPATLVPPTVALPNSPTSGVNPSTMMLPDQAGENNPRTPGSSVVIDQPESPGGTGGTSGGGTTPRGTRGTSGGTGVTPRATPGKVGPPGQTGTAPGLSGNTPGKGGSNPGQTGTAPGKAGLTPGKARD